jgi:hypothetical protein
VQLAVQVCPLSLLLSAVLPKAGFLFFLAKERLSFSRGFLFFSFRTKKGKNVTLCVLLSMCCLNHTEACCCSVARSTE